MSEIVSVGRLSAFDQVVLPELRQRFAVRTRFRHEKTVARRTNESGDCIADALACLQSGTFPKHSET